MRYLFFTLAVLSGLAALAILPKAHAGGCATYTPSYGYSGGYYGYSKYNASYYAPTYNYKEVVVPILAPLPFFVDPRISYHYNAGTYLGVPLVPSAYTPPGTPTTPTTAAAAAAAAKTAAAPVRTAPPARPSVDVDALIDQIERRVRERQAAARPAATAPAPVTTVEDGPPPVPGYASVVPPAPVPYPATERVTPPTPRTAHTIMAARCGSCHTGERSKGDFVIFSSRGVLSPAFDTHSAYDAIAEGRMPPDGRPKLSETDRQILRNEWRIGG